VTSATYLYQTGLSDDPPASFVPRKASPSTHGNYASYAVHLVQPSPWDAAAKALRAPNSYQLSTSSTELG
jgi:uncharacterized protein (DUF1800 family)